jgi:hypothetical protein
MTKTNQFNAMNDRSNGKSRLNGGLLAILLGLIEEYGWVGVFAF